MDDANKIQQTELDREIDELLAEIKKDRKASAVSGAVLRERADRLLRELDKEDLSDLHADERKFAKDLRDAVAEEVASLEADEDADREAA
jgi:hypothetical protein